MKIKQFIHNNLLLIVGLGLPVLVMVVFMIATLIPYHIQNPPKYDLVFSVQDYSSNNRIPLNVNFLVENGTLKAQYTKNEHNRYDTWKKLYLYDAKTQKVKQLSFGIPTNFDKIDGMKESIVNATKHFKLDTTIQSPDGYLLYKQCHKRSSGLFGELFIGYRYNYPCLKKGGAVIKLMGSEGKTYYYPGRIQFIGWVVP